MGWYSDYTEKKMNQEHKEIAIKMNNINKTCSCGEFHKSIPTDAKGWLEDATLVGWVWECSCKSSLFISFKKLFGNAA